METRFIVTESADGDWTVREGDDVVFRGSLDACRDWLDLAEAQARRSLFQRIRDWFRQPGDG